MMKKDVSARPSSAGQQQTACRPPQFREDTVANERLRDLHGILLVILSAIIFGCLPLITKVIYANGGNSVSSSAFRNALMAPVLWLFLRHKGVSLRLSRRQLGQMLLLALGFASTPLLLSTSYYFISSGMATTIHFVYPIFTLLGCVLFCHAPLSRVKVLCVSLCSVGIFLFYTPGQSGNLLGVLLSFLSGLTYAFYIIYLDRSGLGNLPPLVIAFWLALLSFAGQSLFGLCSGMLFVAMTPIGWLFNLVLLMLTSQSASIFFQIGVRIVGPQRASILSTFEPITSLLVGILIYSEPFGLRTGLGVLAILAAVIILTRFD